MFEAGRSFKRGIQALFNQKAKKEKKNNESVEARNRLAASSSNIKHDEK